MRLNQSLSVLATVAFVALVFGGCLDEPAPKATPTPTAPVQTAWTVPDLPKVDAKMFLVNHAKFVTTYPQRAGNTDTHKGAREYLAKQFTDAGLTLYRLPFTTGIPQEDICAVKIGVGAPNDWVIVGGHYDTTTWDSTGPGGASAPGTKVSQGAYDDGSGTWLTVEIAKAFVKTPTYYSVIFCAYDGEERGTQGAAALKKAMDAAPEKFPYEVNAVHAILDMDMIGINWPTHAPIFVIQNNAPLFAKVDEFRKNVLKIPDNMFEQKTLMPQLGSSDYAVWMFAKDHPTPGIFYISDFNDCGVPVPAEDPAPVPGVPCSYPWWHWVDTVETMTAMAGGPEMSQKGFQTALDLSIFTLGIEALHPEIVLE